MWWIGISSMVAGFVAALATSSLLNHCRLKRTRTPHPDVRITVHNTVHKASSQPSFLFLDEDEDENNAALYNCLRCALCPPDEDDQFYYSSTQINRLRFTRWLVEQGHLSEF